MVSSKDTEFPESEPRSIVQALLKKAAMFLAVVLVFLILFAVFQERVFKEIDSAAKKLARIAAPSPKVDAGAKPIQNQLREIGIALHNYHDFHRCFPPAYTSSADGKPLLSWRVAILPFLDQEVLYESFRLDQPWDSKHNLLVARSIPKVYLPKSVDLAGDSDLNTHCLTVRSPRSVFPGDVAVSMRDVTDGSANTIALVELPTKSVPWSSPEDAELGGILDVLTKTDSSGVNVLMTDASSTRLPPSMTRDQVEALVTRNGGELVQPP